MSETPESVTYPTAFIVLKHDDGTWSVTTDFEKPFNVADLPTRMEVRIGCQEIAQIINQQDLASLVISSLIGPNSPEDTPKTATE